MIVACTECNLQYQDTQREALCPHRFISETAPAVYPVCVQCGKDGMLCRQCHQCANCCEHDVFEFETQVQ